MQDPNVYLINIQEEEAEKKKEKKWLKKEKKRKIHRLNKTVLKIERATHFSKISLIRRKF